MVPSTLDMEPSTLDPLPSTLDPRLSTLDPPPSTLDPRPSTLDKKIDSSSAGFSFPRDQLGVTMCYYVKNDVNTLKTNHKMPVGKRDIITFCFFFLFVKKT